MTSEWGLSAGGGWCSHIDMVYVYVPAFWGAYFAKFGMAKRQGNPNCTNWVYFGQIMVKNVRFGQNVVLFFQKCYIDGWEIRQKLV